MGSLEPESNQTVSTMASGHGSGTSSDPKTHQAATSPEVTPAKELSSNLSSSDKDLKLDLDETSTARIGATGPHKSSRDTQVVSELNEEDFPISSMPRQEQSDDGLSITDESARDFPPTQVMERADDCASPDPNRIPPHVFARTKSSAPVEWSVASNESLFSIHMGNMSFSRDHVNWLGKSGELGIIGESEISGPLIDISGAQTPTNKSTELSIRSGNLSQGLGATEAAAAETMREVIRENAADQIQDNSPHPKPDPRSIRPYKHSDDSSIKSFAFPILTGDVDGSVSVGKDKRKKQQSPPPPPQTPEATEPTEAETPKTQTPKATKNATQFRWFSCFSCCTFCS